MKLSCVLMLLLSLSLSIVSEVNAEEQTKTEPFVALTAVEFVNEKLGFAGGRGRTLIRTTDGGKTWSVLTQDLKDRVDDHFNAISFCDKKFGFAVGNRGTILKTKDGGESWTPSTRIFVKRGNRPPEPKESEEKQ